jgi:carboxylesterase type B
MFGGDPKRVVLEGISGGATAIASLVASPLTEGLFSADWFGSPLVNHMSNQTTMEARYAALMSTLNCTAYNSTVDCLRGVSQSEIFEAFTRPIATTLSLGGVVNFPFDLGTPSPPIGGYILPFSPSAAFANSTVNKHVSLVVGSIDVEFAIVILIGLVPNRDLCTYWGTQYAQRATGKSAAEVALGLKLVLICMLIILPVGFFV